jgi:signal peptide peptidase SppA
VRPRALFQGTGLLAITASALAIEFCAPDVSKPYTVENGVACVTIDGPLTQKPEFIWDNYESIRTRAAAAFADPEALAVLLHIDSPGGDVAGCFELAAELRAMASSSGKRFVAFTDGMAASAAYALATAAPEIFVTQTAQVGSIGVINALVDVTALDRAQGLKFSVISSGERKKDGNPHVAITDDAESHLRSNVNGAAAIFFAWVNRTRPALSAATIQSFDGALFFGTNAVKVGLANGVTTKTELLATLARAPSASAAGTSEATMADEEEKKDPKEDASDSKSYEDTMRAQLEEDAKSDDEKKASAAKKMLAVLDGDDDKSPPEKKEEAKSEDEEDSKAKAIASAAGGPEAIAALAADLATLRAEVRSTTKDQRKARRAELIASHDIPPKFAAYLATRKLEEVEGAVAQFPKRAARNLAAAEQPNVNAELPRGGEDPNGSRVSRLPSAEKAKLDERMGLRAVGGGIRREGNKFILGNVTKGDEKKAG